MKEDVAELMVETGVVVKESSHPNIQLCLVSLEKLLWASG